MDPEIPRKKRLDQRACLDLQTVENEKIRANQEEFEKAKNNLETMVANKAEDDQKRVIQWQKRDAVNVLLANMALVQGCSVDESF